MLITLIKIKIRIMLKHIYTKFPINTRYYSIKKDTNYFTNLNFFSENSRFSCLATNDTTTTYHLYVDIIKLPKYVVFHEEKLTHLFLNQLNTDDEFEKLTAYIEYYKKHRKYEIGIFFESIKQVDLQKLKNFPYFQYEEVKFYDESLNIIKPNSFNYIVE